MNAMIPRALAPIPVVPPNPALPDAGWLAEWDRQDFLALDAADTAPSEARRMIRRRLPLWDLDHLAEDLELVATEMISNSVAATRRHGADVPPPVLVWVLGSGTGSGTAAVAVWDGAPGTPVRCEPGLLDESGRGMLLVEKLSRAWDSWFPVPPFAGKVTMAILG